MNSDKEYEAWQHYEVLQKDVDIFFNEITQTTLTSTRKEHILKRLNEVFKSIEMLRPFTFLSNSLSYLQTKTMQIQSLMELTPDDKMQIDDAIPTKEHSTRNNYFSKSIQKLEERMNIIEENINLPRPENIKELITHLKTQKGYAMAISNDITNVNFSTQKEKDTLVQVKTRCDNIIKHLNYEILRIIFKHFYANINDQLEHVTQNYSISTMEDKLRELKENAEGLKPYNEKSHDAKDELVKKINILIHYFNAPVQSPPSPLCPKIDAAIGDDAKQLLQQAENVTNYIKAIQSNTFPKDTNLFVEQAAVIKGLSSYASTLQKEAEKVNYFYRIEKHVEHLEELVEDFKINAVEEYIEALRKRMEACEVKEFSQQLQNQWQQLCQRIMDVDQRLPEVKIENERRLERFDKALSAVKNKLSQLEPDINKFAASKTSNEFYRLNESIIREILLLDKIDVFEGPIHENKVDSLKHAHELSKLLNNRTEEYEKLYPISDKLKTVREMLDNAQKGSTLGSTDDLDKVEAILKKIDNDLGKLTGPYIKHLTAHKQELTLTWNKVVDECKQLRQKIAEGENDKIKNVSKELDVLKSKLKHSQSLSIDELDNLGLQIERCVRVLETVKENWIRYLFPGQLGSLKNDAKKLFDQYYSELERRCHKEKVLLVDISKEIEAKEKLLKKKSTLSTKSEYEINEKCSIMKSMKKKLQEMHFPDTKKSAAESITRIDQILQQLETLKPKRSTSERKLW